MKLDIFLHLVVICISCDLFNFFKIFISCLNFKNKDDVLEKMKLKHSDHFHKVGTKARSVAINRNGFTVYMQC